jgi:hypothetical protein
MKNAVHVGKPILIGRLLDVMIKLVVESWTPAKVQLHNVDGTGVFLFQ